MKEGGGLAAQLRVKAQEYIAAAEAFGDEEWKADWRRVHAGGLFQATYLAEAWEARLRAVVQHMRDEKRYYGDIGYEECADKLEKALEQAP